MINRGTGHFRLSAAAQRWPLRHGIRYDAVDWSVPQNRTLPQLVAAVKELGQQANGRFNDLAVVLAPKYFPWRIDARGKGNELVVWDFYGVEMATS